MSELNELADKLQSEGEKFFVLFAGLTDDQWQMEVYTEGETWTIRNVLSHFVTSERGLGAGARKSRLRAGYGSFGLLPARGTAILTNSRPDDIYLIWEIPILAERKDWRWKSK